MPEDDEWSIGDLPEEMNEPLFDEELKAKNDTIMDGEEPPKEKVPKGRIELEEDIEEKGEALQVPKLGNWFFSNKEEKWELLFTAAAAATVLSKYYSDGIDRIEDNVYQIIDTPKKAAKIDGQVAEGLATIGNLQVYSDILQDYSVKNEAATELLNQYDLSRLDLYDGLLMTKPEQINFPPDASEAKSYFMYGFMKASRKIDSFMPEWFKDFNSDAVIFYARKFHPEEFEGLSDEQIKEKLDKVDAQAEALYAKAAEFYHREPENYQKVHELVNDTVRLKDTIMQTEDGLVDQFDGAMSKLEEAAVHSQDIELFRADVAQTQSAFVALQETQHQVPEHHLPYLNALISPIPLAVAGVIAVKGIRRAVLPNIVDSYISKAVCAPFRLTGNALSWAYSKIRKK